MNLYFDYYRHEGSRRSFPMGHSAMLKWLQQQTLDQPLLIEVIISMSAYSYALIKRTQGASDSLKMMMKPYELFSEPAILVLSQLLVTEGLEGNLEAVDAHLDGLKNSIRTLGGLDALGELILTNIYRCDPVRSLMKQSPPVFAISSRWEKTALEPSMHRVNQARTKFPRLGTRFSHSPWSKIIHPELKSILRSFQDVVSINESFLHSETDTTSSSTLADHKFALLSCHWLLSVPDECYISSLNDTVRLATLVYTFVRIWSFHGKPCLEYTLHTLLERTSENQSIYQEWAPDLFFGYSSLAGLHREDSSVISCSLQSLRYPSHSFP